MKIIAKIELKISTYNIPASPQDVLAGHINNANKGTIIWIIAEINNVYAIPRGLNNDINEPINPVSNTAL